MTPTLAAAVASNALTRRVLADLRASARYPVPPMVAQQPAFVRTTCAACGVGIASQRDWWGYHRTLALCWTCFFDKGLNGSDFEGKG